MTALPDFVATRDEVAGGYIAVPVACAGSSFKCKLLPLKIHTMVSRGLMFAVRPQSVLTFGECQRGGRFTS